MGITVVVPAAIAVGLAGLLLLWSPGRVRPIPHMDGIAEKAT